MMPAMNDIIFIDDSGSKLWDTPFAQEFIDRPPVRSNRNRNFWLKNYFVLAGIYVDGVTVSRLNPAINIRKHEVFGTKYVEIRSSDLRNPYQQRKKYLEKYGMTQEALRLFIDDFWYPIITGNPEIRIQAVVLDKRYFKNRRDKSPLTIATQALLDRIELGPHKTSRIIFDQMDEDVRSTRGGQGEILKVANHEIDLDAFFKRYSHASIGFEKSKSSNFLQIADTVAYNILRQFIDYGDTWAGSDIIDKMYPYFEKIYANFYTLEGKDNPKGVGITKVPDENSFKRQRR
jgi:hypothetical protein